jgi:3'-phosphoadenosine 5'-phosphosulfate sulfotransferase (PAPS reductase)/FAD synthetase
MNELNLMSIAEMREHEWDVPWSGGKDSTATILLMLELGIPIRQVNHVRMMWDDEIPATLPVMYQFVDECVERFRKMGLTVNVVKSKKTAVDLCTKVYTRSKRKENNGKMYGITAFSREMCIFSAVKTETGKAQQQKEGYCMLGYAADEAKRLIRLNDRNQSILASLGVNETECYEICRKEGMLSPHYSSGIIRDGCWFCPNATEHERKV